MNYLDFSPRPKGFGSPSMRASFDETAAELLKRAQQVCEHLLPGGRSDGREYKAADLMGGRGESLSINIKEGVWKDFATDDGGADLISLWASVKGMRPRDAKEEAETWLGKAPAPSPADRHVSWKDMSKTAPEATAAPARGLPKPDKEWTYVTAEGEVWCFVHRFDPRNGERKKIRPVSADRAEYKKPDGLAPLYNLPDILDQPNATVVLVEGEKCVDAIDALKLGNIVATTHIGGAQGVEHTDWSPLKGRNVVRWRDNDDAGQKWIKATDKLMGVAGVQSIRDVAIDPTWPDKGDAADLSPVERNTALDGAIQRKPSFELRERVMVADSHMADRWEDGEPATEYLIENLMPFGRGGFFAALGGTGKGLVLMDLAAKVASFPVEGFDANPPMAFGHKVVRHGRVVILSAEDDRDELRRRLRSMHPNLPEEARARINFIAYPDAGDDRFPFFVVDQLGRLEITDEYKKLMEELERFGDLALTVLDPVSAFFRLDMTTNANSQVVGNMVDRIAKTLRCTTIAAHHMTKGDAKHPIKTAEQARNAVQGGAQLLSSVRFGYAMWSPEVDKQQTELARVGRKAGEKNAVFMGGIVKANYPCSWDVQTFIRNEKTGLLEVPKYEDIVKPPPEEKLHGFKKGLVEDVKHAIKIWSEAGWPPERQHIAFEPGSSRKGKWLHLMSERWQELTDPKRAAIINALIKAKEIEESDWGGFLYLPGDDWSTGVKTFKHDRKEGKPEEIAWLN